MSNFTSSRDTITTDLSHVGMSKTGCFSFDNYNWCSNCIVIVIGNSLTQLKAFCRVWIIWTRKFDKKDANTKLLFAARKLRELASSRIMELIIIICVHIRNTPWIETMRNSDKSNYVCFLLVHGLSSLCPTYPPPPCRRSPDKHHDVHV